MAKLVCDINLFQDYNFRGNVTNAFYNQLIKLPDTVPANFPFALKTYYERKAKPNLCKINHFSMGLDSRNHVRVARRKTSNKKDKVPSPEINEKVSWHLSSVSDCCKQILVVLVQKPPLFAFTIDSNLDLHFHCNYNL